MISHFYSLVSAAASVVAVAILFSLLPTTEAAMKAWKSGDPKDGFVLKLFDNSSLARCLDGTVAG